MPPITVFLFIQAAPAATPIENLVLEAQCAASLDTLERLRSLDEIGEIVVATNDPKFAVRAARLGARVEMDPSDKKFHWGERLSALIQKYRAAIPFYIGGGSGVLMGIPDWQDAFRLLAGASPRVVTNNFFSCDFAGWTPADAFTRIEMPSIDNNLAFRLVEQAGLNVHALGKNAATQLDIDTPCDLLALHKHPGVGTQLGKFLQSAPLDYSRAQRVQALFKKRDATCLIAGRVSGSLVSVLEHATRCQWRVVSEERGMRASGREEKSGVRSLLGLLLERTGAAEFIAQIARMADAAIIDTRVLFAHHLLKPSPNDRFHSDLLQPDPISDQFVRALTLAARDAPIPILFGGHSLVSGGMYALVETAFMV